MADDGGLLAIDVDTDDYTETAAGDTPSVSRTFQSEHNFQAQKASYSAKIDIGNHYAALLVAIPALTDPQSHESERVRLSKRDVQLLGYAVGEMYYDGKYGEILELCGRVERRCVVEGKVAEALGRWRERVRARFEAEGRR